MKRTLLIVDDNEAFIENFMAYTSDEYEIVRATNGSEALTTLEVEAPEVVLLDLKLKNNENGLDILKKIMQVDPSLPVIIVTDFPEEKTKAEAYRLGAIYYTSKAPNIQTLTAVIGQHMQLLPRRLRRLEEEKEKFGTFIGESAVMREVKSRITRCAETDLRVLITGESGTGKEIVAHAIHRQSPRAGQEFIPVNCAAIPGAVFESELFGHERGAFTGALNRKPGKFELAHNGTLFLDEIGDLPLEMQAKLLRTLEDGKFYRVGGKKEIFSNARIIAATNRDLEKCVQEGAFREDLYFRIKMLSIHVPSLRERTEDIPELVRHFLVKACHEIKCPLPKIEEGVIAYWQTREWRGNVRELYNRIVDVVFEANGDEVTLNNIRREKETGAFTQFYCKLLHEKNYAKAAARIAERFQQDFFNRALQQNDFNVSKTAKKTGVDRSTIHRVLNRIRRNLLKD